mgnify:CR=1 FL=1
MVVSMAMLEAATAGQPRLEVDDRELRRDGASYTVDTLRSLSAGQQRRVALARMLLADVPLWLMDEPFTNLDREGRALVMQLVKEHLDKGGMCVMAAHQDVEIDAPVKKVILQ